jgi:hypothetical protein
VNQFFIGLHHPSTAWPFLRSMISIRALRDRQSSFRVNDWILDSGAFTEIAAYGQWRTSVEQYALEINRWQACGNLVAAVTQDMMCEDFILSKTGLSVEAHQAITIERYAALQSMTDVFVLPVLQGFSPGSYAAHVCSYGELLRYGHWVGVGSVCKRNAAPGQIEDVLLAIKSERADLRLHGFGLKLTSLQSGTVRDLLYSSDSMAWSYHDRKNARNGHDPRSALRYCAKVETLIGRTNFVQPVLLRWWDS